MTYEEAIAAMEHFGKPRTFDLIERGYLLFRINDDPLGYNMDDFDKLYGIILNAPSVDVVPREQYQRMVDTVARLNEYIGNIVQCKDCWYSSVIPEEMQNVGEWHCEYWCAEMHGNDFCSCGKEKKRDEDA